MECVGGMAKPVVPVEDSPDFEADSGKFRNLVRLEWLAEANEGSAF